MTALSFGNRLQQAVAEKRSCLVVGLDPLLDRLPGPLLHSIRIGSSGGQGRTAHAAAAFGLFLDQVIDAVSDFAVAVKPNAAFFERYGAPGWDCLRAVCARAKERGLLVILDAKRGDIGHTAEAYTEAVFGDDRDTPGPYVDAVTLSPYLGADSIQPFLRRGAETGKGVFVLVRTSNASASDLQDLDVAGGPLYLHVAEWLANLQAQCADAAEAWSSVGAVVGATSPECADEIRARLPRAWFLVPGLGAQGGKADDLSGYFGAGGEGVLVSASRSVLFAYESDTGGDWPAAIRRAAEQHRDEIEAVRQRV